MYGTVLGNECVVCRLESCGRVPCTRCRLQEQLQRVGSDEMRTAVWMPSYVWAFEVTTGVLKSLFSLWVNQGILSLLHNTHSPTGKSFALELGHLLWGGSE